MEFHARRHIDAPPAAVWSTLLDVGAWPAWDSGVTEVEGTARDGAKVTVHSEVARSGVPGAGGAATRAAE